MPPRKKRSATIRAGNSSTSRSTRQSRPGANTKRNNGIPDVYQEMLAEATESAHNDTALSPRPVKRQKLSPDPTNPLVDDLFESPPPQPSVLDDAQIQPESVSRPQQIIYDDFEESDESDVEFEDVELEPVIQSASEDEAVQPRPLQLDLSKSALETPKRALPRRKPLSKAERLLRLDVHKWHLLSLIGHGVQRNAWCNSEEVHVLLKPLISRKLIKLLHIDESKPMYERNHAFTKGIEEICALWRQQWTITVPGLRRAHWCEGVKAIDEIDDSEDLEFEDFLRAAHTCRGSRDLGAQMFTALLRSIAVEARFVFSLQVLPFTGAAKSDTPSKSGAQNQYIKAPPQNYGESAGTGSPFQRPVAKPKKGKKIVDSPFPVFWTEVLTPNLTWTPLDPIVRNSISKPKTQFEPSLSDSLNSMTYVIAYEDDNSARDVTKRYAQWFNAKTRKMRVESTKGGEQWFSSAISVLRKKICEPRDEIEESELSRRVNSEGMPHNIQDFKNHPVYVLERHMRINEVLQPKREVGKVNVGTAKNGKIESVYRRQDVHLCRTADAWYRRGRDVKVGEQPLKLAIPMSRRGIRALSNDPLEDENDDEIDGVGLYAEYQTNVYEPPPVVNGQIPKNAYGNLDVYVPSMIPPGAVHISHTLAAAAAKAIGIDFADAVTGFEFKGRQGTAIVNGIVMAQNFTAAVAAVIDGLETLGSEEVQQTRSRILLGMWKRMLQALRVRERVEAEYGTMNTSKNNDDAEGNDNEDEDDPAYVEDMDEGGGGGFMPEDEPTTEKVQEQATELQLMKAKLPMVLPNEVVRIPIKITISPHKLPISLHDENRNYFPVRGVDDELFEDDETVAVEGGGYVPDDNEVVSEMGGGFVPDEVDTGKEGGFFAEGDVIEDVVSPAKTRWSPRTKNPGSKLPSAMTASTSQNKLHENPLDYESSGEDSRIIIMGEHGDILHSDAEEDTALQLAIAQSLVAQSSNGLQNVNEDETGNEGQQRQNYSKAKNFAERERKKSDAQAVGNQDSRPDTESPSSLMSHDPNEDDEDPEWLNEALEE